MLLLVVLLVLVLLAVLALLVLVLLSVLVLLVLVLLSVLVLLVLVLLAVLVLLVLVLLAVLVRLFLVDRIRLVRLFLLVVLVLLDLALLVLILLAVLVLLVLVLLAVLVRLFLVDRTRLVRLLLLVVLVLLDLVLLDLVLLDLVLLDLVLLDPLVFTLRFIFMLGLPIVVLKSWVGPRSQRPPQVLQVLRSRRSLREAALRWARLEGALDLKRFAIERPLLPTKLDNRRPTHHSQEESLSWCRCLQASRCARAPSRSVCRTPRSQETSMELARKRIKMRIPADETRAKGACVLKPFSQRTRLQLMGL